MINKLLTNTFIVGCLIFFPFHASSEIPSDTSSPETLLEHDVDYSTSTISKEKLFPKNLVLLNCGLISFYLSTEIDGNLEIIEGPVGHLTAWSTLVLEIRKNHSPLAMEVNPVTTREASRLIAYLGREMPPLTDAVKEKLDKRSTTVMIAGSEHSMYGVAAQAVGKTIFTREELREAIDAHCNLSDEQLDTYKYPSSVVISLSLIYSIMENLNIRQLTFCQTN